MIDKKTDLLLPHTYFPRLQADCPEAFRVCQNPAVRSSTDVAWSLLRGVRTDGAPPSLQILGL